MPKNPTRPWPAKGPAAPTPTYPLSPYLLFSLEKGFWTCFTKDQKGSAKAPPPQEPCPRGWDPSPLSTFSSLSYDAPGLRPRASSHPLSPTPPSSGLSPTSVRLWLPVSWLSWGEGSDRCPGWGGGCPQSVPTYEVPTAHHVPGLGLPPLQLPVPQGSSLSPSQTMGGRRVVPKGAHCGP